MPGGQGAGEERRLGSGCAGLRVAATPRACPCRSEDPEKNVYQASSQEQGSLEAARKGRTRRSPAPGVVSRQQQSSKAHSPSAGTRPRAATASPTSGRRSIRDRPQDYVTAARRPNDGKPERGTAAHTECTKSPMRAPPTTARRHYVTLSGASPGQVMAAGLRLSKCVCLLGAAGGGPPALLRRRIAWYFPKTIPISRLVLASSGTVLFHVCLFFF